MQKTTQVAVPAAGSAPVVIRCSMMTAVMSIVEDGAANGGALQGLVVEDLTSKGFGAVTVGVARNLPPTQEPLVYGTPNDHDPHKPPIGNGGSGGVPVSPGGPTTIGTPICQLTSASANATVVNVTEWN